MKIFDKLIFKNINKAMNIIHFFEWEQPDIISFDFDDTLCLKHGVPNEEIVKILKNYHREGCTCIIVTARNHEHESEEWWRENQPNRTTIIKFLKKNQIPIEKIFFTNHEPKGPILKKLNVKLHYDDKDEELESAKDHGIKTIKVEYKEV
ncbi:MAG: HAD hydrolase family protein [Chryseobacterium sp.]|jgi:acid phosphatase class B